MKGCVPFDIVMGRFSQQYGCPSNAHPRSIIKFAFSQLINETIGTFSRPIDSIVMTGGWQTIKCVERMCRRMAVEFMAGHKHSWLPHSGFQPLQGMPLGLGLASCGVPPPTTCSQGLHQDSTGSASSPSTGDTDYYLAPIVEPPVSRLSV